MTLDIVIAKEAKINFIGLIVFLIVAVFGASGYVWYLEKSTESLKTITPVISPIRSSSDISTQKATPDTECAQFKEKFGTSAQEIINYINNDPDSATILNGYSSLFLKVTGFMPNQSWPLLVSLDGKGKVTKFSCQEPTDPRNYSKDIDATIPESDLAQIVRYRDTLEASQAPVLLQNFVTTPTEAKQILIERIQSLE